MKKITNWTEREMNIVIISWAVITVTLITLNFTLGKSGNATFTKRTDTTEVMVKGSDSTHVIIIPER